MWLEQRVSLHISVIRNRVEYIVLASRRDIEANFFWNLSSRRSCLYYQQFSYMESFTIYYDCRLKLIKLINHLVFLSSITVIALSSTVFLPNHFFKSLWNVDICMISKFSLRDTRAPHFTCCCCWNSSRDMFFCHLAQFDCNRGSKKYGSV